MDRLIRIGERRPLVAVAALLVLVLLVGLGPRLVSFGGDGHAPRSTSLEVIPAAVALTYVRLAETGDRRGACTALTGEPVKAFRCDTAAPQVRACGAADPDGVRIQRFDPPLATVHVGRCTLSLREIGPGDWRVSAVADR
ncbi:hypothetical protein C8N24_3858 [Solirubrobacter pauli]|uniref:Uncharacterized protein n=1 Tax=Solirubrobacter pauli TaxID=166793 RepID=A0A660LFX2_9ACTN|nr:hypothetical protein [Solirubrobacter pauli]RKQ93982.1 hypothetical protein C8N24_3858 [Solirubrobacter pauli]